MRAACLLLVLALLGSGTLALAGPRVYRWVDENGVAHYTTNFEEIPGRLRIRAVPAPAAPVAPQPDVSAPPPLPEGGKAEPAPVATVPAPSAPASAVPAAAAAATAAPATAAPAPEGARVPGHDTEGEDGEVPREPAPAPAPVPLDPTTSTLLPVPPTELASTAAIEEEPSEPEPSPEIRDLERRIENDREAIKALISQNGIQGRELVTDPQFRELAERLPRLESELKALLRESAH